MLDVVLQSIAFDQNGTLVAVARNLPGPSLLYHVDQATATYLTAVGAAAITFRNDAIASGAGSGPRATSSGYVETKKLCVLR